MTINYVDFVPSSLAPFQFQTILDGVQYNVTVTYNIFGQRYYVNIYTVQGSLVLTRPMIGSPIGYDVSITAGMFKSTLIYRSTHKQFEISDTPISYPNFGKVPDYLLDGNLGAFILDQSVLSGTGQMLSSGGGQFVLDQSTIG